MKQFIYLLLVVSVLLAGCSGAVEASPKPTTTATASPSPTETAPPSGTMTLTPTATITPTFTISKDGGAFQAIALADFATNTYGPGEYTVKISYPDGTGNGVCEDTPPKRAHRTTAD